MAKKKMKPINEYMTGDICKCEKDFVEIATLKGLEVIGAVYYYEFTDFKVKKYGIEEVARLSRCDNSKKRVELTVDMVIDTIELMRKIKEKQET